jgi:hypothetical protein
LYYPIKFGGQVQMPYGEKAPNAGRNGDIERVQWG